MRRDEWTDETGGSGATSSWERRRAQAADHAHRTAGTDASAYAPSSYTRSTRDDAAYTQPAYTRRETALFETSGTAFDFGQDDMLSGLDDGFVDPLGGARAHHSSPKATGAMYRTDYAGRGTAAGNRRRNVQLPSYEERHATGFDDDWNNGFSGDTQAISYHERQMRAHAPVPGNYRARPSEFEAGSQRVSRAPGLAAVLALACVVLLIIFIVRAPGLADTFAQANETNAALSEQRSQLDKLKSTNEELQSSINSMQATIDTYNAQKN